MQRKWVYANQESKESNTKFLWAMSGKLPQQKKYQWYVFQIVFAFSHWKDCKLFVFFSVSFMSALHTNYLGIGTNTDKSHTA